MQSLPPSLVPPDEPSLPVLPPRFVWRLPHVKQHGRPTPVARYLFVLGHPMPIATASEGAGGWSTQLGTHRRIYSHRLYREFSEREATLRYVAAWAVKYADRIVAELEQL